MRTHLGHVRASVSDLVRSVAWYEQVLGFEADEYWPPESPTYCQFKSAGGARFSLGVDPGPGARFNFTVEDPDELWETLRDDPRVRVVEELHTTPYGIRRFMIADPDGNGIGFYRNL